MGWSARWRQHPENPIILEILILTNSRKWVRMMLELDDHITPKDQDPIILKERALSVWACPCILFALWGGASRMIGQGKSIAR